MNQITIIGRLGKDPKCSITKSGKAIARFSVASQRQTNKEITDWFYCTCMGEGLVNNFIKPFLTKGCQVCIFGEFQYNTYTDSKGVNTTLAMVFAKHIIMLDSKKEVSINKECISTESGEELPELDMDELPF